MLNDFMLTTLFGAANDWNKQRKPFNEKIGSVHLTKSFWS